MELELREAHDNMEKRVQKRTLELAQVNKKLRKKVSERKQAEEALKKSEEIYRVISGLVTSFAYSIFVESTKKFRPEWVSGRYYKITGYTLEEVATGGGWESIVYPEDIPVVKARRARLLSGESDTSEFRIVTKKGKICWLRDYTVSFWDDNHNRIVRITGASQDITERKQAEEALRESEEKYRLILENSSSAIQHIDTEGKFVLMNRVGLKYLGLEAKDVIGKSIYDIFPETADFHMQRFTEIMKAGKGGKFEDSFEVSSGKHWFLSDIQPVIDDSGNIRGVQIIGDDITERKLAEEKLRESEEKFRVITSNIPDHIIMQDSDLRYKVVINPQLGLTEADIIGKTDRDFLGREDAEKLTALKRKVLETGESLKLETTLPNLKGENEFFEGSYVPKFDSTGKIDGLIGYFRNITENKQAEEALRESEELFRTLSESSPIGIFQTDMDGRVLYLNDQWCSITGMSKQDALGFGWSAALYPGDKQWVLEEWKNHLIENKGYDGEFRFIRPSGEIRWVHTITSPIRSAAGDIIGHVGANEDITERKRAEEALRESEERYRLLTQNIPVGLYRNTPGSKGRFIMANQAIAEMFDFDTVEDFMKWPVASLYQNPDDRKVFSKKLLSQGRVVGEHLRLKKRDGTPIWGAVTAQVVHDESGSIIHFDGMIEDITERLQLEDERARTAKLESIGILAGGIAHDFNNLLGSVMNNIWICKKEGSNEALGDVEKAIFKARDLTQQLLTFSKGGAPVKKVTSLPGLIKEATGFALRGSNVECRHYFSEDLWSCEIDKGQINQVIHNVLINADQAMPNGGVVNVRVENITIGLQDLLPLDKGRYLKISIKDNGNGMPEEHLLQIFDPYFTTKQEGSGLGLTTSYSIIKKHGGFISAESEIQVGTTIHIYLPASFSESKEIEQVVESVLCISGRILVLDDDKLLRDSLRIALKSLGNKVRTTSNGTEAIKLYKKAMKSGQPFDVVILDLTIPGGMGGKETVKKLLEIDPKVKAIVTSGYSNDRVLSEYKEYGFVGKVSKPYQMNELQEILQSLLKEKNG
ncbi:PAS domain S-box protein [Gemmatimonadota bacterium]